MTTPQDVLIAGERHLVIHGQFGNLSAKLTQLKQMLEEGDCRLLLPYLGEVEREVDFLMEIYPALDGGVKYVDVQAGDELTEVPSSRSKRDAKDMLLRTRLRDMRALVDAAYTSHTHEGAIDCHLKIMFDVAWQSAADAAGIERIDDIPF